MNNYANWEITQLLPENEYSDKFWIYNKRTLRYNLMSNDTFISWDMKEFNNHFIKLNKAWSWEDIRLYLESKGFNINYKHNLFDDKVHWSICVNNMANKIYSTIEIEENNYEQARGKAIRYCLTKIKSG